MVAADGLRARGDGAGRQGVDRLLRRPLQHRRDRFRAAPRAQLPGLAPRPRAAARRRHGDRLRDPQGGAARRVRPPRPPHARPHRQPGGRGQRAGRGGGRGPRGRAPFPVSRLRHAPAAGAQHYLPIWIGINEANAIALRITGITPERPITHDLLVNILGAVDVTVDRIVVTSLSNDVFFARIMARLDGRALDIDARPSDAIAVAVRVGARIFVAGDVLERAGVLPEADKEGGEAEKPAEDDEKLTVFREMINSMDLPDLGKDEPGES